MHKKSITCATEFKRKFAVQPHLHPYEFCGGLHMSVARSNSICILESNSRDNPPNCSIFQEYANYAISTLFLYLTNQDMMPNLSLLYSVL